MGNPLYVNSLTIFHRPLKILLMGGVLKKRKGPPGIGEPIGNFYFLIVLLHGIEDVADQNLCESFLYRFTVMDVGLSFTLATVVGVSKYSSDICMNPTFSRLYIISSRLPRG